ncbi:MAG: nitrate reductase [Synoicihabitans sp.]
MKQVLEDVLHARNGPVTAELVQEPGKFGLGRVPSRKAPASTVDSVCGFCATGCSLKIHLDEQGQALNLSPNPAYPVNLGMACPKGWEALTPLAADDRATRPLLRDAKSGSMRPVEWETAITTFVQRMKTVQEKHGQHSIAFLSTGQIPSEEMAFLGALFKFGMGGLHADSNTRQCMATAHVAYKQAFGFDAPPYTYRDFEESDVLIFAGANPAIAHPIMWQRVMRNPHDPTIVVIDPRCTETAMVASSHYAIEPKSDLWLLYGVAHELISRKWVDHTFVENHTENFDDFTMFVANFSAERCSERCGVSAERIRELAKMIHEGKRVSFWWTMGVNQGHQSTRVTHALINLALITGNIGRAGTGANSITGQCNAMGSRIFGNTTSLLGGRDFTSASDRAKVAEILALPEDRIPTEPSIAYDQIIDAIDRGEIRALWVVATNPAHSWINQDRFHRLREKLDFLVVQDMYATTETALMADLILPAAGWGEKDGTFINSERRIGVTRKVARAPGMALTDFSIFRLIAEAWGCGDMFASWDSPEAVFAKLVQLSVGQPFDISGISDYEQLSQSGGIQWPFPAQSCPSEPGISQNRISSPAIAGEASENERRLFVDGKFFTPSQRARLLFEAPEEPPESPDTAFPLWLNTGRGSSAQWHTGSRSNKSDVLRKLAPRKLYVEINPVDAATAGVRDGEKVRVSSRRADIGAIAFVTATVKAGQLFMPMHFPEVNRLTFPAFDRYSRQPSYKACAVQLEKDPGSQRYSG